jgi:hypothetical protein
MGKGLRIFAMVMYRKSARLRYRTNVALVMCWGVRGLQELPSYNGVPETAI